MPITIGTFRFTGPLDAEELSSDPGILVVICPKSKLELFLLDVIVTDNMAEASRKHEEKECWHENCWETLKYASFSAASPDSEDLLKIASELRLQYEMPCGAKTKAFTS